jgi:CubicO group peptidase (beta-lactamase class C family)
MNQKNTVSQTVKHLAKSQRSILLLISLLAFVINFQAQINSEKLDKFFDKKIKRANIIGLQAGFLSNGKLVWSNSYGFKNYKTKKEVNDSTLFLIASCSKPVTALAILKLCDEKKIELDDPINKHLPFTIKNPFFDDKKITIRMLLSHTSSLKDNWEVLDPLYTTETGGDSPIELEGFVKSYFIADGKYYDKEKNFFNKTPGQHWEYCNMGYALLGSLVESVSKKSFSEFMKEEVFEPLQMNNSHWFLRDIPHENIARPHELSDKRDSIKQPKLLPHYGYPDFPDGQLRTTVEDYAKILNILLNDGKYNNIQYLNKKTVDEFLNIQYPEVNKWQAIAWNYNEFENWLYYLLMPRLPSHTGGDPGVATVVSFNPNSKTGAIVFINSPPNTFRGGKIFYFTIVKRLLKEARRVNKK